MSNESLKLKFPKRSFVQDRTDFLANEIKNGKIRPDNAKSKVNGKLKAPTN